MNIRRAILLISLCLAVSACGGGGGSGGSGFTPEPPVTTTQLNGLVQKGPFTASGSVSFFEVSATTGDVATTAIRETTTNESGGFSVQLEPGVYLIEATGTFFDEVSGLESNEPVTLRSIVIIGEPGGTPQNNNLNVLTTLATGRILDLLGEGSAVEDAISDAETAVWNSLGAVSELPEQVSFTQLDMFDDENAANGVLVFISAAVMQIATDSADGVTPESVVADLLLQISNEFTNEATTEPSSQWLNFVDDVLVADTRDAIQNLNQVAPTGVELGAELATQFVDTDGDGISNSEDEDDDNDQISDINESTLGTNPLLADTDADGVDDASDLFPTDSTEFADNDQDGIGDNEDLDDDNDQLRDVVELTRGMNPFSADTDGDGTNDFDDVFPLDFAESVDTDSDGVGDNADTDDDNDQLTDEEETSLGTNPLLADTDADGVNDNTDVYPTDANESADTDLDGIGNNADPDDDNDGIADADDEMPLVVNILVANQNLETDEDTPLDINIAALNTVDLVDGFNIVFLTSGSMTGDYPNLTFTPNTDFNGTVAFRARLTSGAEEATVDVEITVNSIPDAPKDQGGVLSAYFVNGFESIEFGPLFENPDLLPITVTAQNLPAWAELDPSTGVLSGTPSNADVGAYNDITFTVSNSAGEYTTDVTSIDVSFNDEIDLSIDWSLDNYSPLNFRNAAVNGDIILFAREGRDNLAVRRVAITLFDVVKGEVQSQFLLDGSRILNGPSVKAVPSGFVIGGVDENYDAVVTGVNMDGDVLWEFQPAPFTPTTQVSARDFAELADGRIVALLRQSGNTVGDPVVRRIGIYNPATDTLDVSDFDSGYADSPNHFKVASNPDGSYWIMGGEFDTLSLLGTTTWLNQYDSNDTQTFTVDLGEFGEPNGLTRHPTGDLIIAGYEEIPGGWIGRVDSGGILQFRTLLEEYENVRNIAVHANGAFSVFSNLHLTYWSDANELIQTIDTSSLSNPYTMQGHPQYNVLIFSNNRVRSIPAP